MPGPKHSEMTDVEGLHKPKGFDAASAETALVKNSSNELEYRDLSAIGATGPPGPAGPSLASTSVADILDPSAEFASLSGSTENDSRFAYQAGAGANDATLYIWDPTSSATLDAPRIIAGDGGQWIMESSTIVGLMPLDHLPVSTFKSVQDSVDTMQSRGILNQIVIGDNGDGTISIAAMQGTIRIADNESARIQFFDVDAIANFAIPDDGIVKALYVEYNAGLPQIVLDTIRSDVNTNIQISRIFRDGLDIHIHQALGYRSADTNNLVSTRLFETAPFERIDSGGALVSETGTRNFAVTAGSFWECLNPFTTDAFDSSVADTFDLYHKDGVGGFTKTAAQTQIDNLQYDDGTGTLATLANNQYGVHWIYLESDSDIVVLYGEDTYTLTDAEGAAQPAAAPKRLETHGRLIAKIIILKSAAIFTDIGSAFDESFTSSSPSDHSNLINLQGGSADEFFHLTSAEYARFQAAQAEKTARSVLSALEIDFAGDSIKTKTIAAPSTFTFTGISASTLDRVITLELTGNFAITLPASVQNRVQIQDTYNGAKTNWIYFNVVDSATQVVASIIIGD